MSLEPRITIDAEPVKRIVNLFPIEMAAARKKWLNREGTRFIGSKAKAGLIRRGILKRTTLLGKVWQGKAVNLFRYKVHEGRGLNAGLEAGLLYTNRAKIHEVLEKLRDGGAITSTKYMIIPHYSLYQQTKKPRSLFKTEDMYFFKRNNKLFYINKATNKLMFIGQKRIKIKKIRQLDVEGKWATALPGVIQRGNTMLEKTVAKLNKKIR